MCPKLRPKSSKNELLSSLLYPVPQYPSAAAEIQKPSGRKNFSPGSRFGQPSVSWWLVKGQNREDRRRRRRRKGYFNEEWN
jgi:hypothetical protein